jgi:hydroxypyruvate isomerase
MFKQDLMLGCFCDPARIPVDEFFKTAAEIGYAGIELCGRNDYGNFDDLAETAARHGLVVVSFIGHESLADGLNRYENHDRIESELRESIDVASRHSVPGIICFSGNRNPTQSDSAGAVACAHGLRGIAPYAEEKGVTLNVELLNSRQDHGNYQCDSTDWGVALCEMVNSPKVKLLYDIYHMQIMEGHVISTIRKHIKWIGHFHTAGNPGRRDLDNRQEIYYPAVARAIAETGYDLYVGHEYIPKADPIESIRHAFEVCRTPA